MIIASMNTVARVDNIANIVSMVVVIDCLKGEGGREGGRERDRCI